MSRFMLIFKVDLLIFQPTLLRLLQNCFFHFPLLNFLF